MAIKLRVNGGVVQPGVAFTMSDAAAARARAEGMAKRLALNPHGQAAPARVRQASVVEQLAEQGRLRAAQVAAAREIEGYWHWWTGALFAGTACYGERLAKGESAGVPASVRVRASRYRDWAGWAEREVVKGELNVLALTLDMVVDGRAPWALRERYRMGVERVVRVVQISLLHYATLAGWVEERNAA
jgi:hypothetical protein